MLGTFLHPSGAGIATDHVLLTMQELFDLRGIGTTTS
ncbi:hypothetical protein N878_02090 [Pseudomonas sp. EGD-AK9]|nr:hypothetical protein N878_02090 [Pseudomonas sp. EGD-AK9]